MAYFRVLLLWSFIFVLFEGRAQAQILQKIFFEKPGLQIGMYQGQTKYNDIGYNYYFRLYNQHTFDSYQFGELSISSGNISGVNYRSRLTPLEYRFGIHLSKYGVPNPSFFGKQGSFYSYGGVGILFSQPLDIVAPDDPLTVEMGNRLPNSSFWNFEGGIAPFVPVGVGLEISLEQNTSLNISAGYNQSINSLKFNNHHVPSGYWAFSIGLNFGRAKTVPYSKVPLPSPPPIARYTVPAKVHIIQPATVEVSDISTNRINYRLINFDVLSSHLNGNEKVWLKKVTALLMTKPEFNLQVIGHADGTGTDLVNQMISESRARAVWLALIDEGVDVNKISTDWYSDSRPIESNASSVGRYRNRRVELKITKQPVSQVRQPSKDEVYVASIFSEFEYDVPLLPPREIEFTKSYLGLNTYSRMILQLTAYLMHSKPEMDLLILSRAEIGPGTKLRTSLAKARAELIRGELILKGVNPKRVKAAIPGTELYEQYEHFLKGDLQQNLLIPLQQVSKSSLDGDKE